MKLLTGLVIPSGGKAWVSGEEVRPNSISLRRKIGYLPEEPAFYNWMTGRGVLSFVGELHHLPAREIRLRRDELLDLVDLEQLAESRQDNAKARYLGIPACF
ncbi:hypothetical protein M1O18_01675 [Dehalococcoidia bacterium]|nr:hypothetical protein [Dehalococcoidia bacterium]